MNEDPRTEWQKRMGVGESQHRDLVVTDLSRTNTYAVPHERHGGVAGYQTHHRSGRVDAFVTPECHRVTIAGKSKEVIIHE